MNKLSGLGVAMVTPFTVTGKVDFPALQRLVEHLLSGACDFFVVLGTTAETPTLTLEEQRSVLDFVIEINAKRKFIVVGLAGNDTAALCDRIENFDLTGVDAVLSACPHYNKPTQDGLRAHFTAVAEASNKPVMLYNVPSRTGCNLAAETTLELANHPNIFAIKEASGDLTQIDFIIKNRPSNFLVFSGDDALTLAMISSGADGVISVIGNALPTVFGEMVHQALFGQIIEARQAHLDLATSIDAIFAEGNPSGIKAMLEHLGICSSNVRLPLVPASQELKDKIYSCLAQLDKAPN
ncbi:MAG: 4-hydroxy-tetrahydrodipicolinate synthase [Flavobacteriales bacterium]|jgi:4-hydroxy-tetrahydrodipicolinate synthase|nr:4-hydroxy-tetrahydrodipicolinate synthase [Flavobacteriales bacterium]